MARKNKKQQSDPRGRGRKRGEELQQENTRALSKKERRAAARRNEPIEDEYDYIEDDRGINKASMKKAMRFVIIAIVFFVLSVGVFFGSGILRDSITKGKRNACWTHQQEVQQLAYSYMNENHFSSLPAYVEDIPGYEEGKCPSGGEYTWDPIDGKYTCSVHGDVPSTFNQAQSKKVGQTTTIINKNSS